MAADHESAESTASSPASPVRSGRTRVRLLAGFACLALAGVLIAVGILVRGPGGVARNPAGDPVGFASLVTSTAFSVWILTTVASVQLRMYGFLAIYAALADTAVERLSLGGLLLTITSMALFLHVLDVAHFVWPEVGRLYQAGQTWVFELAGFPGTSRLLFVVASLLGLLGLLLYGVAIWRSERFPTGAGVLLVLHVIPLNLGVLGYQFESVGGFVLLVSAVWLAVAVQRDTSSSRTGAGGD